MVLGGFEFSPVLPQLGRNKIEVDRAIDAGFIVHGWNFVYRLFLFYFGVHREWSESIFVKRPATLKCAATQLDIVFLVSCEISQRERVLRRIHYSQVALHS